MLIEYVSALDRGLRMACGHSRSKASDGRQKLARRKQDQATPAHSRFPRRGFDLSGRQIEFCRSWNRPNHDVKTEAV